MKSNKSLGLFMFLSVLGFLFEGCASLATEKQTSLPPDTQTPIISTVEAVSPPEPFIMQSNFLPATPGQTSLLSSMQMFTFPMDDLNSLQFSSTTPLSNSPVTPATPRTPDKPSFWHKVYELFLRDYNQPWKFPIINNPYNQPRVDSPQETCLKAQELMLKRINNITFSKDILVFSNREPNFIKAPVPPKSDFPPHPIIIRK
jgi:hypothetical protein